jgi:hypothetical protein
MTVYRGVVKGNTVLFEEPVDLPDGIAVEVRPISMTAEDEGWAREETFQRYLLETGFISRLPTFEPDPPGLDRTPIPILSGPPVSQTIIEERR